MAENFYQILGIGVKATQAEIKSAYKKLALLYHPDVNQGSAVSEEKFKKILEAYQTLSDEAKRNRYDMKLFFKAIRNDQPGNPDPAYRNVPQNPRQREDERYRKSQPQREAYREYHGPARGKKLSPHMVALALLVVSSFVMISYWLGYLMNHHMAEKSLLAGNFHIALEYDDEYAEAYYARYSFFSTLNVPKGRLLRDLNLAIQYSDEPIAAWFLERARLLATLGDSKAAYADFIRAKTIDPDADSIWLAMADFHSLKLNQPAKALVYYDTALMINNNLFAARLGKAEMLFRMQRLKEAESALTSCVKTGKAGREVFYMRGATLIALGRNQEACEDLNQALIMGYVEARNLAERYCPGLF